MVNILVILAFILCLAIAAAGILISSEMRNTYKNEFFSTLMYLQTFYFTYGFYAIWGQVLFITVFSPLVDDQLLGRVTNILLLLGSPFVIFTWLMLLKIALEFSGRHLRNSFVFLFLAVNLIIAVIPGLLISEYLKVDPFTLIRYGFIILNFIYAVAGVTFLLKPVEKKAALKKYDLKNLSVGILIAMVLQNALLFLYKGNLFIALAFIIIFFISGSFIPVYVRYKSGLSFMPHQSDSILTIDSLCEKFEISPREKEIVREICNGLSNQQIADKLFISLQTVKDHTSRIYFKINCNSRAQLITMVRVV
jgi:DNA-binding CsgD family transcriptional regulator